jgi:hypothetical protein
MSKFKTFLSTLEGNLKDLAKKDLKDYQDQAVLVGANFVSKTKADLEEWTNQLEKGELSRADFKWLVKGKKDLAEMQALEQAGLALVARDRFVNSLTSVVADTAFSVFL